MKKMKLLSMALIGASVLGGLSSCGKKKVTEIDFKEGYEKDVEIGKFDASNYTILETYSDGSVKEVTLTDAMIPDASRMALYTIGEQKVEIVYLKTSIYLTLNITRATFDITMPSKVVTYDGTAHSLDIEGYYPKGTTITYPLGSSFTNVGTYDVEAILNYDNYETKTLHSTIQIVTADYDLDVSFSDKEFTYDEEEHSIEIQGTLPEDVSVTYTINGDVGNTAVNAGTYNVTALFTSKNMNYNPIPSLSAKMTINKAVYSTDLLSIGQQDVQYTGELIEWKIINTLPSWISVTYVNTYKDENGELAPNTSYVQKERGRYDCVIDFTVLNSNYEDIPELTYEVWIY